ncbi:hypothetical protein DFJ63DRAFT_312649 [Scheffersomyces coipomensis]|uniref:uncharacterized protein n=1 Tax=Scheffersomyces coipomensis TaxID=1788519 RepID=UPI00315DD11E
MNQADSIADTFITRPTTALQKVIDKFSTLGARSQSSKSEKSSTISSKDVYEDKSNYGSISASKLQAKFGKVLKIEQKLRNIERDLIVDLLSWAKDLPSDSCESMIKNFATLSSIKSSATVLTMDNLDKIKSSLASVEQRERKRRDAIDNNVKLLKELKDYEARFGSGSNRSQMIREKIESNSINLETAEMQFVRSISTELKESLLDYVISLQVLAKKVDDSCIEYSMSIINTDMEHDSGPNSKRLHIKLKELGIHTSSIPKQVSEGNRIYVLKNSSFKSPIKESPQPIDDLGYALCAECHKMKNYERSSNHPSANTQNSNSPLDSTTSEQPSHKINVNGINNPSRISTDDGIKPHFQFRDNTYVGSDNWN